MNIEILLVAQLMLAAGLLWSCFCRVVHVDASAPREVRWALLYQFIAVGLTFGAPLLPMLMPGQAKWMAGTTPIWVWIALMGSLVIMELTSARQWMLSRQAAELAIQGLLERRDPRDLLARNERREQPGRRWANGSFEVAAMLAIVVAGAAASWPTEALSQAQAEPQPRTVTAPIFNLNPGEFVQCDAPEGCVIFTKRALIVEFARYADQACRTRGPGA